MKNRYHTREQVEKVTTVKDETFYVFPKVNNGMTVNYANSLINGALVKNSFLKVYTGTDRNSEKVYINPLAIYKSESQYVEVPSDIKGKIDNYDKLGKDAKKEDIEKAENEINAYFAK